MHGAITLPFLFAPRSTTGTGGGRSGESPPSAERYLHRAWLTALRAGDVTAFDHIVGHFSTPLQRFVARLIPPQDAADIVQDVFVWLWEHRSSIDPSTNLRAYLYTAARNRALHLARRARMAERAEVELQDASLHVHGMGAPAIAPDLSLEQLELSQAIERALETLSPRVRHVALLRWQDGLRRDEIAHVLGVSPATIKNQLATAIRALRPLVLRFHEGGDSAAE